MGFSIDNGKFDKVKPDVVVSKGAALGIVRDCLQAAGGDVDAGIDAAKMLLRDRRVVLLAELDAALERMQPDIEAVLAIVEGSWAGR
jgi:hypothetical protein